MLRVLRQSLFLALPLLLAAPLLSQDRDPAPAKKPGPTAEEIGHAVDQIEQGFESKLVAARLEAATLAAEVPAEAVAKALAKHGLRDSDVNVRRKVIESLGLMEHPAALDALLAHGKKAKKDLAKDDQTLALLVKSVGRHGSEKSIAFLSQDVFGSKSQKVTRARILSLGQVRSIESVEALVGMTRLVGRGKLRTYMEEVRLSLVVLTGEDFGESQPKWNAWWNDNKRTLKIDPKPATLPRSMQKQWERYWADPRKRPDEGKKKGERGSPDKRVRGEGKGRSRDDG